MVAPSSAGGGLAAIAGPSAARIAARRRTVALSKSEGSAGTGAKATFAAGVRTQRMAFGAGCKAIPCCCGRALTGSAVGAIITPAGVRRPACTATRPEGPRGSSPRAAAPAEGGPASRPAGPSDGAIGARPPRPGATARTFVISPLEAARPRAIQAPEAGKALTAAITGAAGPRGAAARPPFGRPRSV